MGDRDIHNIHPIYRHTVDVCKLHNLPFTVKEDLGSMETAIQFKEEYFSHPPFSEDWETNPEIVCPDVIILYNDNVMGIIEYEEKTGNRKSGARMARKGHGHEGDYDTKKDSRRNEHYETSKIPLHRIWESRFKKSNIWKIALTDFIFECYRKTLNDLMKMYQGIPNLE